VLIDLIAGALVVYSVQWLELHLSIDDPAGAISVHALGGLWGLLVVGMLARLPQGAGDGQWIAQLAGVATLVGFVLPLTYGLNWLLNHVYPKRVAPERELQGLGFYELGAGAYPDFMSHNEDFWQR
jgi:Amt family ammonium transporter